MSSSDVAELKVYGFRSALIDNLIERITKRFGSASGFTPCEVPEYGWRKVGTTSHHRVERSYALQWTDLARVAMVNALSASGHTSAVTIEKLVRSARDVQPDGCIIVVLDEGNPEAVRAALDAGADEFLGRDELENDDAVIWRLQSAVLLSQAERFQPERARSKNPRSLTVRKTGRLSPAAVREADQAIYAAVAALPSVEERRALDPDLLEIIAPELRDTESGRLDAKRIAAATGLSLTTLARASGVTQQALSATPDSPTAQAGLLPVARISGLLDELLPPEHKLAWLQTPRARFGNRTPKQAIEEGDAELVSLVVGAALEGSPD